MFVVAKLSSLTFPCVNNVFNLVTISYMAAYQGLECLICFAYSGMHNQELWILLSTGKVTMNGRHAMLIIARCTGLFHMNVKLRSQMAHEFIFDNNNFQRVLETQ